MEIRAVELADVSALGSLFVQWGHPLGPEDLRLQVRRWRDAPLAELYVALVQGELAGMAAIAAAPHLGRLGCTAKLMGLVVGERHRRQGVGHARKSCVAASISPRNRVPRLGSRCLGRTSSSNG
jgi:GNAT superfamily N-acetyltransferase